MAYSPITPGTFAANLPASHSSWSTLCLNLDSAYVDYNPPILNTGVSLQTQSTTDVMVAEWLIPGNADRVPVVTRIRWRGTTAFTATATVKITDGVTTDTGSATRTTSSYGFSTITVTPTSAGTVRYGQLWLRINAVQACKVDHIYCGFSASSFGSGVLDSGAIKINSNWEALGLPIPSELVARGGNTLRGIAIDRPACLVGGLTAYDDIGSGAPPGPVYSASGWTLVDRWIHPHAAPRRDYLIVSKLSGTNPELRIQIGPGVYTATGTGWATATQTLSLTAGQTCSVFLRSSTGGTAKLDTYQLFRGE